MGPGIWQYEFHAIYLPSADQLAVTRPPAPVGLLAELKRRKVVRAGLVYGAGAFAVLQTADIVVEPLGLPPWVMPLLIWVVILGFPVTLVVSWFVDISRESEGVRRWLSLRTAAAAIILCGLGLAGWWLRPGEAPGGSAALETGGENVVVVLPFTVLGSEESQYLSDAVARLLSTSIDGTAGLRVVSSHALMGYPGLNSGDAVGQGLAREVAEHFGAGFWLVGDVLEAGDSLRIEATLVNRLDPDTAPVSAKVTAGIDDLFSSVDQLAALLVAEREAGEGSERTRIAAITTSSMEALRAYIEGERAFRAGSYLPAVDAFNRAVEADAEFALAWYRLSMTEERLAWAGASQRSAEAAWQNTQRLPAREREFLEAIVALRRGNTSEAEQMLRNYVRAHPDDPEAWYQLGEILFHGEPLRGGSMTAAREPLEHALFYDPGDLGALYHLVRISIKDGDAARMDSLTDRFLALSPSGGRTLELRALQAAGRSDRAAFETIVQEMRASPDPFLPIAVWSIGVFGQDLAGAEEAARLMAGNDRPKLVRGAGHLQLAYLALAQGRYGETRKQLDQAQQLGDPDAAEARAWLATLPFIPSSVEETESLRGELEAAFGQPSVESPNPSSFFSAQNGVHDLVKLYLQGILASRSGDGEEAIRIATDLENRGATENARGFSRQLAAGVKAQEAFRSGDPAQALNLLSNLEIEGWYELTFVSPYYSGALERFTLAELLVESGRQEEALAWYQGLRENSTAELVFTGPALLREAAIHRQAGREELAGQQTDRFRELWASADPELREAVVARYGQQETDP
jgi:tetratricopeptide (TPR) repeat protein